MAGFDPSRVDTVASLPYALTLWTFLQREEAEYFRGLVREYERLDEADMITRGFIQGTQPISDRFGKLISKTRAPVAQKTREQLERDADELFALHASSIRARPVS